MPPGRLGVEGLAEAVHIHGGLHHRVQPGLAQGVSHAQAVDHRAQHAHLIRRHRVHVGRRALTAPPDVPRTNNDADLHLHIVHIADDLGHPSHLVKIEQIRVGLQRLAGELEQNPLVCRHVHHPFTVLPTTSSLSKLVPYFINKSAIKTIYIFVMSIITN